MLKFDKFPVMPYPSSKVSADLLRRLREGDAAAFGKIYEIFAPVLYQRLWRLLKDSEMVEDILQDTFLKIWEKREEITLDHAFTTYLYRYTANLRLEEHTHE